ncbi:MAG TPA: hypothetical protein VJT49_19890 [Amycolatopsis sp.]|nr:hypothetical protein [Amycolatopsis sp.]
MRVDPGELLRTEPWRYVILAVPLVATKGAGVEVGHGEVLAK